MSKALAISVAPKTPRGYTERCLQGADDPGQAMDAGYHEDVAGPEQVEDDL